MRLFCKFMLALMIIGLWSFPVRADEVADQIKEALDQYEKGNFSEAVSNLNFAVGQIQQKQAADLKGVFPEPLEGWKAKDSTGDFAPAAFMGGGVSASRNYYVEETDKSVDIEIVTDSPILQSVMMFFTNPTFTASQPDTKLVKIGGHKALQKFNQQDREGEINIVIASRMLVSIKSQGSDKPDDMLAYANAMDFSKLEKFLEK